MGIPASIRLKSSVQGAESFCCSYLVYQETGYKMAVFIESACRVIRNGSTYLQCGCQASWRRVLNCQRYFQCILNCLARVSIVDAHLVRM